MYFYAHAYSRAYSSVERRFWILPRSRESGNITCFYQPSGDLFNALLLECWWRICGKDGIQLHLALAVTFDDKPEETTTFGTEKSQNFYRIRDGIDGSFGRCI